MANRMAKQAAVIQAPAQVAQAATGAVVGYARTSTVEQEAGLDAQARDLKAAGCTKLFSERLSSIGHRPQLAAALDYLREGDVLVVTKPDRLARSTAHLLEIVTQLEARGVGLRVLSMGGQELDTRNPTSRLTLTVLAAIAEFERTLMLERQKEGIAAAKADGKYKGRKPTVTVQADEMRRLLAGGMTPAAIARHLGVARSSVYRVIDPAGSAEAGA